MKQNNILRISTVLYGPHATRLSGSMCCIASCYHFNSSRSRESQQSRDRLMSDVIVAQQSVHLFWWQSIYIETDALIMIVPVSPVYLLFVACLRFANGKFFLLFNCNLFFKLTVVNRAIGLYFF
jgi:hypothetical protein